MVNDSSSDKNEIDTAQQEPIMEPKIYNVTSKDDGVTWGMIGFNSQLNFA